MERSRTPIQSSSSHDASDTRPTRPGLFARYGADCGARICRAAGAGRPTFFGKRISQQLECTLVHFLTLPTQSAKCPSTSSRKQGENAPRHANTARALFLPTSFTPKRKGQNENAWSHAAIHSYIQTITQTSSKRLRNLAMFVALAQAPTSSECTTAGQVMVQNSVAGIVWTCDALYEKDLVRQGRGRAVEKREAVFFGGQCAIATR